MDECILSPSKRHQHLDKFQEYTWEQQLLGSSAVDTATTLSPDDLLLHQHNPRDLNFENWSEFNDLEFGFMPSTPASASSLLELGSESPISSSSFTSAEDLFDDTGIDPNVLSGHLYNKPAAACRESLPDFLDLQSWQYSKLGSSHPIIEHHALSPREIQRLYAIAMPGLERSLESSDSTPSPKSEPEVESQTQKQPQKQQAAKPRAKSLPSKHHTAHNMIEKRYRNNLNTKIAALRDSVPSLRIATKESCSDTESAESDLGGKIERQKLNKATILSKAIEYISHLEKLTESLSKENTILQSRATTQNGLSCHRKVRAVGI